MALKTARPVTVREQTSVGASEPPVVWFETTLGIVICVLLGFSLTAVPLAMVDWFRQRGLPAEFVPDGPK
jgi:hypothetical protein